MSAAEKLAFNKSPGFYWLRGGGEWTVVRVTREYHASSDYHVANPYFTMVAMLGKETKWSIYYFAEAEWGQKIESPEETRR